MFGLVLSGGGLRGAVHVGFLSVLDNAGIKPDLIVGSSAGSIAAALYASDVAAIFQAEEMKTKDLPSPFKLDWRLLFVPCSLLRHILGKFFGLPKGLFSGTHFEWALRQFISIENFQHLKVPIAVVTCDITNGMPVVFTSLRPVVNTADIIFTSSGTVVEAVRASSSIPGLFAPKKIGNRLLVDGGVVNNCPADIARYLGATKVVAVDLGFSVKEEHPPDNAVEILLQSTEIMGQRVSDLITAKYADLTLRPDTGEVSLIDLAEIPRLYKLGRRLAEDNLPAIKRLLAGK